MVYQVFYSWQSDLPNATNRGFIEKALENAAKSIRDDDSIQVEPVVDRDTVGVPGAPDIAQTILDKIESSQVFVCDVSIINEHQQSRPSPNPNVLVELGYALKALGPRRVVMVMNTAFGQPNLLPFDLRLKRVIPYDMPKETKDRAMERKRLGAVLEKGLRAIIAELDQQAVPDPISEDALSTVHIKLDCRGVKFWPRSWGIMPSLPLRFTIDLDLRNTGEGQGYLDELCVADFQLGTDLFGDPSPGTLSDSAKPPGYRTIQMPYSVLAGYWSKSLVFEVQVELRERDSKRFAARLCELGDFEIKLQYGYENMTGNRIVDFILVQGSFTHFVEQVLGNWSKRNQAELVLIATKALRNTEQT